MAEKTEGLNGGQESPAEGLFDVPVESPKVVEEVKSSEPPKDAKPEGDAAGMSATESGDSDMEGIFTDLEKETANEAEKARNLVVKKRLQGYLTKKTQGFAEEKRRLEANQITEELKNNYGHLYSWYDSLRKDPKNLKALAKELGVKPEDLLDNISTQMPDSIQELKPENLETRQDYVNYAHQEIKKAVAERDKKIDDLTHKIETFSGKSTEKDLEKKGAQAVLEASTTLPGFLVEVNGEKKISENAMKAFQAVLNKEFIGPNAIKNAYKAISSDTYETELKEAKKKVEESEKKFQDLQNNLRGVAPLPSGEVRKTSNGRVPPSQFWDGIEKESLTD